MKETTDTYGMVGGKIRSQLLASQPWQSDRDNVRGIPPGGKPVSAHEILGCGCRLPS